jgi:hypothetical protein
MATQATYVDTNTPIANRPHLEAKAAAIKKALDYLFLMVVVATLAAVTEAFIYGPIISANNYLGAGWQNTMLAYAIPVIAAFGTLVVSLFAENVRAADGGRIFWIIGITLVFALEALFFWWGWELRREAADSERFAFFLNIVAILAFVFALLIDIYLSRRRQLLLSGADIAGLHVMFNSTERSTGPFCGTSTIDLNRAVHDFNDLIKCFDTIAGYILTNFELTRDIFAQLYAASAEQAALAKTLPYNVNGTLYSNREEAHAAIKAYLGAPSEAAFRAWYGPDLNVELDKRTREALADHRARYNAIIAANKGITEY